MALATLSITFTPQVTSNHRVCWKKTTDLTYDCSTIVAGTAGTPVTANITVTVVDDPCEPATFEGYVQPTCEPESSPLVRTDFPDVVYSCGACDCPSGYAYNPATGFCEQVTYSQATPSSTTGVYYFLDGDTNASYNSGGAYLYEDISQYILNPPPGQTGFGFAGYKIGSGSTYLIRQCGDMVTGSPLPNCDGYQLLLDQNTIAGNCLFRSCGNTSDGRLNIAGLWAYTNGGITEWTEQTWLGFKYCINITNTQTYIFGISGDNQVRARISLDGGLTFIPLITLFAGQGAPIDGGASTIPFQYYHMFPITLNAGSYILELSGWDNGSYQSVVAEIYSMSVQDMKDLMNPGPIDLPTGLAQLEQYTVFSTKNIKNSNQAAILGPGSTVTFTCPGGGTLSDCYGGVSCITIDQQPCGTGI